MEPREASTVGLLGLIWTMINIEKTIFTFEDSIVPFVLIKVTFRYYEKGRPKENIFNLISVVSWFKDDNISFFTIY